MAKVYIRLARWGYKFLVAVKNENDTMKALLIIDMQKVSFTSKTPRFNSDDVIKRINILSDKFRKNGDIVIFIQHNG